MILDKPALPHYDVIIIGSGPAGITTALEIAKGSTAKIAIIESGLIERDKRVQQLAYVQHDDDLVAEYFPVHTKRCFGGSSTVWGGFCATLEERAFTDGSWPIPYEAVAQWYPAAAHILELPANVHQRPAVPVEGTSEIVYKPFYLSRPVRFNEKYHNTIQQHPTIHLLLGKTCSRLVKRGRTIVAAELLDTLSPLADTSSVTADQFVIACGGVGNPRMLLLSDIVEQTPVGVGLMEHPHLYAVAQIYLDRERILPVVENQFNVIHALQLSNDYCIKAGLLSFSVDFTLHQASPEKLLGQKKMTTLTNVAVRAEIAPDPRNRVSLGAQRDYLSQPVTQVDFHYRCDELVHNSWAHFSRALLKSGLGRPSTLVPELKPAGGGHLMGTTRMGYSETDSVVDSNCKVHSMDNLYVAGSSVFPAGGASNPTYSIVAMSLRLGDHLARVLQGNSYG